MRVFNKDWKGLVWMGLLVMMISMMNVGYAQEVPTGKKNVLNTNYYDSIDFLVKRFRKKFRGAVRKNRQLNTKVSIVSFNISEDLPYSIRDYALQKLERVAYRNRKFRFKQCKECLSVRAHMVEGEVYITKGLTSNDELESILKKLGSSAYAEVVLVTAKPFLKMLINIYTVENKVVLWKGEFHIRSEEPTDLVTHATLGYGVTADPSKRPLLLSTFIGEKMFSLGEIGFESVLGGYYTTTLDNNLDAVGVLFQFGAKIYFNLHRIMTLNDGFITPHLLGGLKVQLLYDDEDILNELVHQSLVCEGGLLF